MLRIIREACVLDLSLVASWRDWNISFLSYSSSKGSQWQYFETDHYDLIQILSPIIMQDRLPTRLKKGKFLVAHATKVHWDVELLLHLFFASSLAGGEWLTSRSGSYSPQEIYKVPIW